MDNINREWVIRTNELADLYDNKKVNLTEFSDDQLIYLAYWNWGYSGAAKAKEALECEADLIRRGNPYNQEYADKLLDLCEDYQ